MTSWIKAAGPRVGKELTSNDQMGQPASLCKQPCLAAEQAESA